MNVRRPAATAGWTSIFNGRDLEDWHKAMERVDSFGEQGAAVIFLRQPKIKRGGIMLVAHFDGDIHLKTEGWKTVAKTGVGARSRGRSTEGGWLGFYAFNQARVWIDDLELRAP